MEATMEALHEAKKAELPVEDWTGKDDDGKKAAKWINISSDFLRKCSSINDSDYETSFVQVSNISSSLVQSHWS